ncbi:cytochrome P450 [Streptomyces jumonjinensis]|uniref:cytochrome P450 n=1 Tax=Streptomyces jumonjinensis TaxID=1945 RepID=UPI00379B6113
MNTSYTMASAPGALPLLGHTLAFAHKPLEFISGLPAHGDLVRVKLGPLTVHVVCHPDLVHRVLTEDRVFDKGGPVFEKLREVGGDGVISCPAQAHRRQRRLVQPAFHRARMPGYAGVMAEEITALTDEWRHGQVLDVPAIMYQLTTAVTTRCLFTPGKQDTAGLPELYDSIDAVTRGINRRAMLPVPMADKLPTPGNRRYERARSHLTRVTETLIAGHRAKGLDQGDLLSVLLAPQDDGSPGLTDAEIHAQVINFLMAGVETTAGLLSWAWHLVGTHPAVRDRLQAEVDSVLGGRPAQHADLPALELTGRVLTEALRLYPPAWLLTRSMTTGAELGGHHLPAGATIMFSAYQVHRRASVYPDPERFDPDRWRDTRKPPPGTLLPFGGGPRKCIGDTFATVEATLALATIAARWQLDPVPGPRVHPARRITLIPDKLAMRLSERGAA